MSSFLLFSKASKSRCKIKNLFELNELTCQRCGLSGVFPHTHSIMLSKMFPTGQFCGVIGRICRCAEDNKYCLVLPWSHRMAASIPLLFSLVFSQQLLCQLRILFTSRAFIICHLKIFFYSIPNLLKLASFSLTC